MNKLGKYQIRRTLGKGAMGIVYLAHDTILERDVALKVMVASIADDPELKTRFEREAKAVARMTHPNVVNVFDLGSHTDGSPFIAIFATYFAPLVVLVRISMRKKPLRRASSLGPSPGSGSTRSSTLRVGANASPPASAPSPPARPAALTGASGPEPIPVTSR